MPATRSTAADPDQLLTLAEVGELLRVSPVTAWRRVKAGHLPAINVGVRGRPQLRVRRAAVQQYIRSREIQPLLRARRAA